jgi:secondary thiamine-phosphate synthase enzyme
MHLVTEEVRSHLREIEGISAGVCHLFILHTSASISLNENADPTVRADLEEHLGRIVPDAASHYRHDYEGDDDMSAHIKSSLLGAALTIPIRNGRLALGTWQGIYLCEHRDRGGPREMVATLIGEEG